MILLWIIFLIIIYVLLYIEIGSIVVFIGEKRGWILDKVDYYHVLFLWPIALPMCLIYDFIQWVMSKIEKDE